jgi:hypothetical protein
LSYAFIIFTFDPELSEMFSFWYFTESIFDFKDFTKLPSKFLESSFLGSEGMLDTWFSIDDFPSNLRSDSLLWVSVTRISFGGGLSSERKDALSLLLYLSLPVLSN